jgi:hypothetical protein
MFSVEPALFCVKATEKPEESIVKNITRFWKNGGDPNQN